MIRPNTSRPLPTFLSMESQPQRRPLHLLLALLLLMLPSYIDGSEATEVDRRTSDCGVLKSFQGHLRQGNHIPTWSKISSWNGADCCGWAGVTCTNSQVTSLELPNSILGGSVPLFLSNLTSLTRLDLSHNNLSGSISEIKSLDKLQYLDLSWNNLEGNISFLFGSRNCNLEVFNVEHNNLTGEVPSGITDCSNLKQFVVAGNSLGNIFPFIDVRGLKFLDFSSNKFTRMDTNGFSALNNLRRLNISYNNLAPVGLEFLWNLKDTATLQELDLSANGFKGSIWDYVNNVPSNVRTFRLRNNSITGHITDELLKLTNLNILDMGGTSLSGILPISMKNLTNLTALYLDHNGFDGGLNETLMPMEHLQVLDVSHNLFIGPIPVEVFNSSSSVTSVNLSSNAFNGTLPDEIGHLPNLTTLDVSSNNLSGIIPLSLENCKQLELLILRNNTLNGTIPDFFGKLQKLKLLDLSFNDLEGRLPTGGIFDDPLGFLIEGNSKLCQDYSNNPRPGFAFCNKGPPTGTGEGRPTGTGEGPSIGGTPAGKNRSGLTNAALAVIVIVVIVFLLLILFWLFYKHNCFMKKNFGVLVKDIPFLKAPLRVTCGDLQAATKGFSSTYLIGSGGIGSVYRGFLEHAKKEVAVKVLKEDTSGDSKTFLEECHSISTITHRNLVKMLTSCLNVDIDGYRLKALVYEFMPNGNLEMWLHEEVVSQAMSFKKWNLNLYQRLSMAIDVASGLSHLHCNFEKPIVHSNLKPSNILISEDMTAHISDFGMNKLFKLDTIIQNVTGYIAPECSTGSPVSPMWDVYSFGVILLEMFTGKRPTGEDFGGTSSLHKYVLQGYHSNIEEIIDPLLLSEETSGKLTDRSRECIISILNTALRCSKAVPGDRMVIQVAREKLEKAKSAFLEAAGDGEMQHTIDRERSSMAMLV